MFFQDKLNAVRPTVKPDPQQVADHFVKDLVELVDQAQRDGARVYQLLDALEGQLKRLNMNAATARPW